MSVQTLEVEQCPGQLQWSAFGASYPDTVCSSVLTWENPADHPGRGVLCDADDDFRAKDVPCPFCAPKAFLEYQWGDPDEYQVLWADDQTPVPLGTAVHFHDGRDLTLSATHPTRGEQLVLVRSVLEDDEPTSRSAR